MKEFENRVAIVTGTTGDGLQLEDVCALHCSASAHKTAKEVIRIEGKMLYPTPGGMRGAGGRFRPGCASIRTLMCRAD
jgi:hypothetical protein